MPIGLDEASNAKGAPLVAHAWTLGSGGHVGKGHWSRFNGSRAVSRRNTRDEMARPGYGAEAPGLT
jgi:hypothetical protein